MKYYTKIGNGQVILATSMKAAVSHGLKASRRGETVQFYEEDKDGSRILSEMAHRRLETLNQNTPVKSSASEKEGHINLHNSLVNLAMESRRLAASALKRDLTDQEIEPFNTLLNEVQESLYS